MSIKLGDAMFATKVIVADSLTTDVILRRDFLQAQSKWGEARTHCMLRNVG